VNEATSMQKRTQAEKLYKECSQSYMKSVRYFYGLLAKGIMTDETDSPILFYYSKLISVL